MADGGPPSWLEHLADELRLARKEKGWSQGELADAINFSRSRVADIETGREVPTQAFVRACDDALTSGGLLERIWTRAKRGDVARRIADLMKAEAQATLIRDYHPVLVPGLLQTERYMRELFGSALLAIGDSGEIELQVAQRLARQGILAGTGGPRYVVIVDEGVIRRPIGSHEIMHEQLSHLLAMTRRGGVTIQVQPFRLDTYPASGPIKILDAGGDSVAHFESPIGGGLTTADTSTVRQCNEQFDLLRAQALTLAESIRMIEARIRELGP